MFNVSHGPLLARLKEEFPDSYNPQPYLLGSFPADASPDVTGHFGCGPRAKLKEKEVAEKYPKQLL